MPERPQLPIASFSDLPCPTTDSSRGQKHYIQRPVGERPSPDPVVDASDGPYTAPSPVPSPPFPDHPPFGTDHNPTTQSLQQGIIPPEAASGHHQEMQWELITKKLQNKGSDLDFFGAAQNRAFVPRPSPLAQELPNASETSSIRKVNSKPPTHRSLSATLTPRPDSPKTLLHRAPGTFNLAVPPSASHASPRRVFNRACCSMLFSWPPFDERGAHCR